MGSRAHLRAPVGVQGVKPPGKFGVYANLGVGECRFSGDLFEAKIIDSFRSICGLIKVSYRYDNGWGPGTRLRAPVGVQGRSSGKILGFYAILGVGERGFGDDFLKQKS